MSLSSFLACTLLNTGCILFIMFNAFVRCELPRRTPFIAKMVAPFCLSSSVRALIELQLQEEDSSKLALAKVICSYLWIYLMAFMLLFIMLEIALEIFPMSNFCSALCGFIGNNIRENGVNKKTVRYRV